MSETPLKILLADDEAHLRLYLKTALVGMGYQVVGEAGNGQEAIELYRKHRPDLLLLDINMPVMNGREALDAIRKEFPGAFVIMLTSIASGKEVEACLDAGAANYLRKDTPLAELRTEIQQTCDERFGGRNASGTAQ